MHENAPVPKNEGPAGRAVPSPGPVLGRSPAAPAAAFAPALVPAFALPAAAPVKLFVFWQLCLLACALPLAAAVLARALQARTGAVANGAAGAGPTPGHSRAAASSRAAHVRTPVEAPASGPHPGPEVLPPSAPTRTSAPVSAPLARPLATPVAAGGAGPTGGGGGDPEEGAAPEVPSDPEPLPFHENPSAQPHPASFLGGNRPTWEQFAFYARQRRVDEARGREMVRNALGALAEDGFFVFEDVLTVQDGAIDQLVVGPTGVHPVVVMAHRGYVHSDPETNALIWGRTKRDPDLPDHESRYWHGFWEESPQQLMQAFRDNLAEEVVHQGIGGMSIFCFTEATLVRDADGSLPSQTATPFDLAQTLREADPEAHGYPRLDGAHVRELARLVVQNYKRLPWVVPPEHADFAALLEEEL